MSVSFRSGVQEESGTPLALGGFKKSILVIAPQKLEILNGTSLKRNDKI